MTLEPRSILDGWRDWDVPPRSRPKIVRQLGGGRSNRSYLLEAAGERMVLRINAAGSALHGIKRENEAEIWRAASDAGIAPPLIHADPSGRFLVSAYIESDLPERPEDNPALAAWALGLLQKTHQLDVQAPTIDYSAHIEGYWEIIESRQLKVAPTLIEQREPMLQRLARLQDGQAKLTLCHHDPVIENFVGTPEHLYLIDWEYAAHGLAVMDHAALAVEWMIGDEMLNEQAGIEPVLLDTAKALYQYMCALWSAVQTIERYPGRT
jgi:thiamine kinase-like enzyme